MAKTILVIHGGGDRSVGIGDTDAEITIQDNLVPNWGKKGEGVDSPHEADELADLKQYFADFYDVPLKCVLTKEQYDAELEEERRMWEKFENAEDQNV